MSWLSRGNDVRTWRLSEAEAGELAGQVAALAEGGLSLEAGLRAGAEELGRSRPGRALGRLADELSAGRPLGEALQSDAVRMPTYLRALITASLRTGSFSDVLGQFLRIGQSRRDLRRRLRLTLAYPSVLLVMMMILFMLLQALVGVPFGKILHEFGVPLPTVTQLMIACSGIHAWYLAIAIVAPVVGLSIATSIPGWRWSSRVLYALPAIGPLYRWQRQAEFCRLMAVMVDRRIALPDALRLTAEALPDADLAAASRQAAAEVASGRSFHESLAAHEQFMPTLSVLARWGEQLSAVPEGLRAAAEMFEARLESHEAYLGALSLPVTLVVILAIVATFVAAFMLPLIGLIQRLI